MNPEPQETCQALRILVQGVVQGVGFRPFVYRLAHRHELTGWVQNAGMGVCIHIEGPAGALQEFVAALSREAPPAAAISQVDVAEDSPVDLACFEIRPSRRSGPPTVRISPDLSVCPDCLHELLDPEDRHYRYPYINCTNCGPRYSIVTALPYDRAHTTMQGWPMCPACASAYHDPADRRFHAQPAACPVCGPQYNLHHRNGQIIREDESVTQAAQLLREGKILAVKGLGGYHLICDAHRANTVRVLRERKYRKEKPFALMVPDLQAARRLVQITGEAEELITSAARPIVLLPLRDDLNAEGWPEEVAPGNVELGIMLPYTPLHALLFEYGAPHVLVVTSANRSNEPIIYRDSDAFERLSGIADAFLVGERPIARRVEDSVARIGPQGPMLLRRARGYAPGVVTHFPATRPILALGADLKNTVTMAVGGEAYVSQYVGDLEYYDVQEAFLQTVDDLTSMYEVPLDELLVVHDRHPQYRTTTLASTLPGDKMAVQHHRAHIASVLAERQAWEKTVVGFAFDGTGYGDDGTIWGGEVFAGSLREGLTRVAHVFPARLPGGDAAASTPAQAAAGFLSSLSELPDLTAPPFGFPPRFHTAMQMAEKEFRSPPTTSMGRLFDTVAALLGFTRIMTFEGQAASWLEQQAREAPAVDPYPFPSLDYRPVLQAIITDRQQGRPAAEIARAFHAAVAHEVVQLGCQLCGLFGTDTIVLSGGVFQNNVLLHEIASRLGRVAPYHLWTNQYVPANDGGISLGQAALTATVS
jgi:hydrogenase maturation protein HypF